MAGWKKKLSSEIIFAEELIYIAVTVWYLVKLLRKLLCFYHHIFFSEDTSKIEVKFCVEIQNNLSTLLFNIKDKIDKINKVLD